MQEGLACRERLDLVNAIEYLDLAGRGSIEPGVAQSRAIASGVPAFLSSFMPKSGGTHLHNVLVRGIGAAEVFHSTQSPINWTQGYLLPSWLAKFMLGGASCHTHMKPSPYNLRVMAELGVDRIWVHVRDPRQAVLSAFHHSRGRGQGEGEIGEERRRRERGISDKLHELDRQDDSSLALWPYIAKNLPWMADWIACWTKASELGWLEVLFTRHEDLVNRKTSMLRQVVAFFGGDPQLVPEGDRRYPEDRFRKGGLDEWRTELTAEQQRDATRMLPSGLLDRFDWRP